MKAAKKDIIILSLIALGAAMLLGSTYTTTLEPIKQTRERNKQEGLRKVMPFLKGNYTEEILEYEGKKIPLYIVIENGEFLGAAMKLSTNKGYSGNISFLLGVDALAHVTGLLILEQRETPGLGAKATEKKWWGQFIDKFKPNYIFKVKKDGGNVDSITASTITSRAISNAVDEGLDAYAEYLNRPGEKDKKNMK